MLPVITYLTKIEKSFFMFFLQSKPHDCTVVSEAGDSLTVHYTVGNQTVWIMLEHLLFLFL